MDREHLILREIVETHIDSGDAVGSKAIAERLHNHLSSASIRAVMHALGLRGWVTQPHTSSGRVPTDLGYRAYLDDLCVPGQIRSRDRARVESLTWRDGASASEVARDAAQTAAEGLGAASLVVVAPLESSQLQRIELVLLGPRRVLAIAVTVAAFVHERVLVLAEDTSRHELEQFTNYLNTLLPGRTLAEVRHVMEAAQNDDRNELERRALALGQRALEQAEVGDDPEVLFDGAARVLAAREFAEAPERSAELVAVLETRSAWIELLARIAEADDTRVYLGNEVGMAGLGPCSLVARRFQMGRGVGFVALLGPKRLDYRRAIPIVGLVAQRLGEVLAGAT